MIIYEGTNNVTSNIKIRKNIKIVYLNRIKNLVNL